MDRNPSTEQVLYEIQAQLSSIAAGTEEMLTPEQAAAGRKALDAGAETATNAIGKEGAEAQAKREQERNQELARIDADKAGALGVIEGDRNRRR